MTRLTWLPRDSPGGPASASTEPRVRDAAAQINTGAAIDTWPYDGGQNQYFGVA